MSVRRCKEPEWPAAATCPRYAVGLLVGGWAASGGGGGKEELALSRMEGLVADEPEPVSRYLGHTIDG